MTQAPADCLFCRIIRKEIPSQAVHEDALCYAFLDIAPKAPLHVVLVPKAHVASALELDEGHEAAVGHLARIAAEIARKRGIDQGGFRLVMNTNADAGQTVFHLHMHLLGGQKLGEMA
jgi:histidine triad (HIT) family protein